MQRNQRNRKYSPEFRARAIGLAKELGNANEAARKLGMPGFTLQGWLWEERNGGKSKASMETLSAEEELRQLKRENEELKKANYILKQAAAFFSQDHLK